MGLRGGPNFTAGKGSLALLYSTEGDLLSVMSYPFSNLRVGAATAVSTKYMARKDSRRIGLIGTGRLALSVLRGGTFFHDIDTISVYGRDLARRAQFCGDACAALGIATKSVDTPMEAVAGQDIVLVVTSSREPVVPFDWHLSSIGPISELHADLLRQADRLVVGTKKHERDYYMPAPPFPLVELTEAGKMRWDDIAELGEIVLGEKPGRVNADEITVFHESQGGFGDIMFAGWIYDEARRLDLGQEFAF
jgi:ornithine cyclodeaminase/alanine dehydrogenase-like protein (mu-crystallin family)